MTYENLKNGQLKLLNICLTERVQEGEWVGGWVEDGEEDNRQQDKGDRSRVQEYQREEQIVRWNTGNEWVR